jgi:outer membrane protein, heavy metal efflux system
VTQALAQALRSSVVALQRASRSSRLLESANRVAALSLLAYREGAQALPTVLEAQRTAREAQAQYVEDVAAARNTASLVRLLTLTANRTDQ